MITRVGLNKSESGRSGSEESPTPTLHDTAGHACTTAAIENVAVDHPAGEFSNFSNTFSFNTTTSPFNNNNNSYIFNSSFQNTTSCFPFKNKISSDSSTSQFLNCSSLKKGFKAL